MKPLSLSLFTWNKETKTISAEDSTIRGYLGGKVPEILEVHNPATGVTATFQFAERVIDEKEHEIVGDRFKCLTNGISCRELFLWND